MAYQYGAPGGYPDYGNMRPNGGGYAAQYPGMQYNAPVIRMGLDNNPGDGRSSSRYDNRGRAGIGADYGGGPRNLDRDRQQIRETMLATQPPTREEVARTIFIGGLGESAPPDSALESILRCAGKLRRWTRAHDANDKKCRFGFAEYEDVDSLETAKDLFGEGVEAPLYKNGQIVYEEAQEGEEAKMQMNKLLVVIDEQSSNYIVEWMSKREDPETARAFRLDAAHEDMRQCLMSLRNGNAFGYNGGFENGDVVMADANGEAEAVDASGSLDDELADIPAEMRATVAQEIKHFRDRANRRDQERTRQEEEYEAAHGRPHNRLASPGPGTNGTRPGVAGAPSGPRGYRGAQLPSDYVNGVSFVSANMPPEDNSDASDTELERRRVAAHEEEQEKRFLETERRWLNRERQRTAAQERERTREAAETRERERQNETMARRYGNWNDDEEQRIGREEFYYDRSTWSRKRVAQLDREARDDDRDRQAEQRAKDTERRREDESKGAAERFLAETGAELAAAKQTTGAFKISLGGARSKATRHATKAVNDVAGLLEEEEDAAASGQRKLRSIHLIDVPTNAGANMTEEELQAARKALAMEIPSDAESLFAWEVRWNNIHSELLEREIRPFVEQKVVDFLGLQEDFLVDIVMNALKEHKPASDLVLQLEKILDEEAEDLVKKIWRLVVYFGEAEGRGFI